MSEPPTPPTTTPPQSPSPSQPQERLSLLQIVTLLLSAYVLIALTIQSIFPIEHELHRLLDRIDFYICFVFLTDFFVNLYKAPSKKAFLKWGWIDFLASIPMLDAFRAGRVVRVFRVLRAYRSSKYLISYFLRKRKGASMLVLATISMILVVFSAIAILQFETEPESNIKTPQDALWWAYTTVTTVGYGDRYPLSNGGRVLAALLMTVGVGLFGTFTGFVASHFLEPEFDEEETEIRLLTQEIKALRAQVSALEEKIDRAGS